MSRQHALLRPWSLFFLVAGISWMHEAGADVTLNGDAHIYNDGTFRTMDVGGTDGLIGSATVSGLEYFAHVAVGAGANGQGVGSMTVSGPFTSLVASNFVGVGTTGTGTLLINNGASVVSQGGLSPFCSPGCDYTIIANGGGSTGTVTVDGYGSSFQNQDSLNNNAGFIIGNGAINGTFGRPDAQTNGYFNVLNGATASTTFAYLGVVYRYPYSTTGRVKIDGAGSTWNVNSTSGVSAMINVGYGGYGQLSITNGGTVNAEQITVATLESSTGGSLTVAGSGSRLNLTGRDVSGIGGAHLTVGSGAYGTAVVQNGALMNLDAGNGYGGITVNNGSVLTVSGGSQVHLSGAQNTMRIQSGVLGIDHSVVDVAYGVGSSGQVIVGGSGGVGQLVLSDHSTLNAGSFLGVGNAPGQGEVHMYGDSVINASNIVIGSHGFLGGQGMVNGAVTNNGGVFQVGASPDALILHGSFIQHGGEIHFEVDPDGHGGFLTSTLVLDAGSTVRINGAKIFFDFSGGATAKSFLDSGGLGFNTFFKTSSGDVFSQAFKLGEVFTDDVFLVPGYAVTGFDSVSGQLAFAAAVPEPSEWLMLPLGLLLLAFFPLQSRLAEAGA